MGSIIKRPPRPEGNWNQVPERLLQGLPNVVGIEKEFRYPRPTLSGWARAIGGWIYGRPDGWEMDVEKAKQVLRISDYHWEKSLQALIIFGYVKRWKWSEGRKKIHTEYRLLEPARPLRRILPAPMIIILKSFKGESFRPETFKPKAIKNKNKGLSTKDSKTKDTPNQAKLQITLNCYEQAKAEFAGYDIESLEQSWGAWVQKRIDKFGEKERPKHPDQAFLGWVRKYVAKNPLPYAAKEFG